MWGSLVFAYMLVSRTAYVLGIGLTLSQQDRHQRYTRRYGTDEAYRRFRLMSSLLMLNDGTAFVAVTVLSTNTMVLPVNRILQIVVGTVIAALGIGIKAWATARLGADSWYWHNFFVPSEPVSPDPPGPYRYMKNPMYVVGYLQTYGFALMCASWPGMIAGAYMQASILVFNQLVEKPHLQGLRHRAGRRPGDPGGDEFESGAAQRLG